MEQSDLFEAERRATQAKGILESPIWIEAWQVIEQQLYEGFCDTPTHDTESLTHIRLTKSIMDSVKAHIEQHMITGQTMRLAFE
ncbi:MAG: hypothetical protein ACXABJ_08560, partial [Candidatus Heimdallarchaeaceae archaeon]